jgi:transglutaminase-like putative cysteine protease
MADLVREYRKHPDMIFLAREISSAAPQKGYRAEASLIHAFVRDSIRYVRDVLDVETLQSPDITLAVQSGDCDDKSILAATLLTAIGHPVRFTAVAIDGGELSHVLPETKIGSEWVAVETTEPVALGWFPQRVTNQMRVYI